MSEIPLKPCPFCGSVEFKKHSMKFNDLTRWYLLKCIPCGGQMKALSPEALIMKWNKRIGDE
jgi:Lar family restriction alleviation protein